MKKWTLFAVVILAVCLLSGAVEAQQVKKIGTLDLSKVFDNYEKTKEYDKKLEGEHDMYTSEREKKVEKFKELQGKLALLKEEEKGKVEDEVEALRAEIVEFDQTQRTDLTKQRDEKIREILLEIENVVNDFAKKEKYDLILNDRVLIYGDESMDVSDQILEILNSQDKK